MTGVKNQRVGVARAHIYDAQTGQIPGSLSALSATIRHTHQIRTTRCEPKNQTGSDARISSAVPSLAVQRGGKLGLLVRRRFAIRRTELNLPARCCQTYPQHCRVFPSFGIRGVTISFPIPKDMEHL